MNRQSKVLISLILVLVILALVLPLYGSMPSVKATGLTIVADANGNAAQYYIPVTLNNSQTGATGANFQCLVTVNSSSYSSYLASNLSNVVWEGGNGNILKSWMEGCFDTSGVQNGETNTSTITRYWVLLTSSIAANSTQTIYYVLTNTTANSMNSTWTGAEPNYTATYGQYDNGASIFPSLYDNFTGTTLNSALWNIYGTSGGIGVNNNITINGVPGRNYGIQSKTSFNQELVILDMFAHYQTLDNVNANEQMGFVTTPAWSPQVTLAQGHTNGKYDLLNYNGTFGTSDITGGSTSYNSVWSLWGMTSTLKSYLMLDYNTTVNTALGYSPQTVPIISESAGVAYHIYMQWIRIRVQPPSSVMPASSFGSLSPATVYLTTSASAGGTVAVPGVGTYAYNISQLVSINASANSCYHFVNWTGSTANITNVNAANTTINMMTSNQTATANFAINQYTLSYTAGSGGTLSGSTSQTVNCGGNGSAVTAVPNSCYHFVNWNDSSISNPRTDTNIQANASYLANFAVNTSTITYSSGGNGTISGTVVQTVNCGSNSTSVTAVPSTCCSFLNWSDGDTSATRSDLGTSTDQTFTANFIINTSIITYLAGTGGTISGTTPQTINCGTYTTSVTASPSAGYYFINWSDGGTSATRIDIGTSTNQSFTANFVKYPYTVTYLSGMNGTLFGDTVQYFNYGGNGSAVLAVPGYGYYFFNWSDGSASNPRTDINVTANLTVTADFALIPSYYSLSLLSNDYNCSPTFTGANPFINGSVVSISANTPANYTFIGWSPSTGISNATAEDTSVTMFQNTVITAYYLEIVIPPAPTYDLTVLANNSGGQPYFSGTNPFINGSLVNIYANVSSGYTFGGWWPTSGITNISAANTSINMSTTRIIEALYSPICVPSYNLVLLSSDYNCVPTFSGTNPFPQNALVDIYANTPLGYTFIGWQPSDGISNVTSDNTTVNMSQTRVVAAYYSKVGYTLTVSGNNSGSNPYFIGSNPFAYNTSVSIFAGNSSCCTFIEWLPTTGVSDPYSANTTVLIIGDTSLVAYCSLNYYNLTLSSSPVSGGNPTFIGSNPFSCGSLIPIYANTSTCWSFQNWSPPIGLVDPNNSNTTVLITKDMVYTANFLPAGNYTLTVGLPINGNITDPGENATFGYSCGTVVNLTAVPGTNCTFSKWIGDIGTISNISSYSTNITISGNYSINCSFIPIVSPPINVTVAINKSGTPSQGCVVLNWTNVLPSTDTAVVMSTGGYCNSDISFLSNRTVGSTWSIVDNSSNVTYCSLVYEGNLTNISLCGLSVSSTTYFSLWGISAGWWSNTSTQVMYGGTFLMDMIVFFALVILAIGMTFVAFKVRLLLFRVGSFLLWLALGVYVLIGQTNFGLSDTWVQLLGWAIVVIGIGILTLQFVTETRHTTKDGMSYTSWGRMKKKKLTKSEEARERQSKYQKDFYNRYIKR